MSRPSSSVRVALLAPVAFLCGVLPARAAEPDREAAAEKAVKRHRAENALLPSTEPDARAVTKAAAGPSSGLPLHALYDDGFRLRSDDGKTELRIVWSGQLDARMPMGESVAPSSFDIRRARLDLLGTIHKKLFIRIGLAGEDQAYIRNAFADYAVGDALHLRVGQMKVPFSTEWATFDNQVNFVERAHSQPIHPFLDRGILVWGSVPGAPVVYNAGLYTGAGVDLDAPRGDVDASKLFAYRLFAQPFRESNVKALRGVYLVAQGTYEPASAATRRFEARGLQSPTFESNIWRWRADQTLGTNGRNTDTITAELDGKARVGAEAHYVNGPFTFSAEASVLRFRGVDVSHDFMQGSRRLARVPVLETGGTVKAASAWVSVFLTGEQKTIDNFGWRQPNPKKPVFGGEHTGPGAIELLARASVIQTDASLFTKRRVRGFSAGDLASTAPGQPTQALQGDAPGEGAQATVSVLEGAEQMNEVTLGVSWALAYAAKLQLNFVHTWVPNFRAGENGIVSGAGSELADPTRRNTLVPSESLLALRFIFRI